MGPAFPLGPTSPASCKNRTVPTQTPVNGRVSNWFSEYPPLRPPLPGNRDADVCIVGAGYTGLWTAYYLKRADPSLRIVYAALTQDGLAFDPQLANVSPTRMMSTPASSAMSEPGAS